MKGHNNPGSGFGKEAGAARKTHRVRKVVARAQSVLVALSLLATLGVSSPLIATAEELPEPADTQTQSADSAADNTADATTTGAQTDSSADADGEQTDNTAQAAPSVDPSASADADSAAADVDATDQAADADASQPLQDSKDAADVEDGIAAQADTDAKDEAGDSKELTEEEQRALGAQKAQLAAKAEDKHPGVVKDRTFREWLEQSPASKVTINGKEYTYSTLGMILSNYNIFTPGDFRGTHVVGPVAVGGFATGFGAFNTIGSDTQQDGAVFAECMGKLDEGDKVTGVEKCTGLYNSNNLALGKDEVDYNVPVFVGDNLVRTNKWPMQTSGVGHLVFHNKVAEFNEDGDVTKEGVPMYLGAAKNASDPFLGIKYREATDDYETFKGGKTLFSDTWLNFDAVMAEIQRESNEIAAEPSQAIISVVPQGRSYYDPYQGKEVACSQSYCMTVDAQHAGAIVNQDGKQVYTGDVTVIGNSTSHGPTIVIKPGVTVTIKADANYEALRAIWEKSTEDPKDDAPFHIDIMLDDDASLEDVARLNTTIINYDATGGTSDHARLPGVRFVQASKPSDLVQGIGTPESGTGIPIVFNYPNFAGTIDFDADGVRQGTQYGHVVAPNADINMFYTSGNFNGTYIAKNIAINGEGHMWPYTGRLFSMTPDSITITAKKKLTNTSDNSTIALKGDDFTFEMYEGETEVAGEKPIDIVANDKNGDISFGLRFDDSTWGDDSTGEKTFTYRIKEKQNGVCSAKAYTCDRSEYVLTVKVKKEVKQEIVDEKTVDTIVYTVVDQSLKYKPIVGSDGKPVSDGVETEGAPTFANKFTPQTAKTRLSFNKYLNNELLKDSDEETFKFELLPAEAIGTQTNFTTSPMPKKGDCSESNSKDVPLYGKDENRVMDGEKEVSVRVDSCVVSNKSQTIDDVTRNVWFPEITYNEPGKYEYVVREVIPSPAEEDMTYDTKDHNVSVTVTQDSDGTMHATPSVFDPAQNNFRNYSDAHVDLHFTKYKNGLPLDKEDDRSYDFELYKVENPSNVNFDNEGKLTGIGDKLCTVSNLGQNVDFLADECKLTYTADDLGSQNEKHFYYVAVEKKGPDSNWLYDPSGTYVDNLYQYEGDTYTQRIHYVDVKVTKDGTKLTAANPVYNTSLNCLTDDNRDASGSCSADADAIFYNQGKKQKLIAQKSVEGDVSGDLKETRFTFNIKFFKGNTNSTPMFAEGTSLTGKLYECVRDVNSVDCSTEGARFDDGTAQTFTVKSDGSIDVTITSHQRVEIENLPYETVFEMHETGAAYTEYGKDGTAITNENADASSFFQYVKMQAWYTPGYIEDGNGENGIPASQWLRVAYGNDDSVIVTTTNRYTAVRLPMTGGEGPAIRLLAAGIALLCAGMFICMQYARKAD